MTSAHDQTAQTFTSIGIDIGKDVFHIVGFDTAGKIVVTVKIKYADFRQATRSRTLRNPVVTREDLHEVSVGLVRSVYPVTTGIRLVGVTISKFGGRPTEEQLDLGLLRDTG